MLGIAYILVVVVANFFIKNAPTDFKPKGWTAPVVKSGNSSINKNWKKMLQTPEFYLIIFMLGVGAFSGLMIASNAAVIGQEMFGLTAAAAAFYVSLYSLSNCLGRVLWGTVSDRLGRTKTLLIIYTVVACSLLVLALLSGTAAFAIGIIGLGLCFGGVMGVFPSMVMENYYPVNQGVNYGIVFIGYSTAAFLDQKLQPGWQRTTMVTLPKPSTQQLY